MMVDQRWSLRSVGSCKVSAGLHRVGPPVAVDSSHGGATYARPVLIRGMVEERSDVVYEKRV